MSVAAAGDRHASRARRAGLPLPPADRARRQARRRVPSRSATQGARERHRRRRSSSRRRDEDGELVNEQYMTAFFRKVDAGETVGELAPSHRFDEALREQAPVAKVTPAHRRRPDLPLLPGLGRPDADPPRRGGRQDVRPARDHHPRPLHAWRSRRGRSLHGGRRRRRRRGSSGSRCASRSRCCPARTSPRTIWKAGDPQNGVTTYAFETTVDGEPRHQGRARRIVEAENLEVTHMGHSTDGSPSSPAPAAASAVSTHCSSPARAPRSWSTTSAARNDGTGADVGPAQEVVDEIVAAGGEAVANTDNVATWDGAEEPGRPRRSTTSARSTSSSTTPASCATASSPTLSEEEWDLVIDVHLKGHFARAASRGGVLEGQVQGG